MLIDLMNNHTETLLLDLNMIRGRNRRSKMRFPNGNNLLQGDGRWVHIIYSLNGQVTQLVSAKKVILYDKRV